MKKRILPLVLTAVALAAVLALAYGGYRRLAETNAPGGTGSAAVSPAPPSASGGAENSAAGEETEPPAQKAPDFTVFNDDGESVSLSDYQGKPVVINFWATWCPPCRSELPGFDAAWEKYGSDVQFLMVDLTDGSRETEDTVRSFLAENGYRFPVFYDTEYSGAAAYGVYSIPVTVFVDAEGVIRGGQVGAMAEETLTAGLEALLGR